jgi:D-alanyl-D-alanine carboxypeptidase/D-alanyl-D-alanine-endopeptidase (penicillin-binding protein 4)
MPGAVARALVLLAGLGASTGWAQPADPPLQAAARNLVGEGQGVYAEAADGTVLASQAAERPVHPASVTKVASSLALLEHLGPAHRFETRVSAAGDVRDGRVLGDLVVEAAGDPTLVYENVFLLLARLRDLGVRAVAGGLTVRGPLLFNWKPDPTGDRVQRALAGRDGADAWAAVRSRIPSSPTLRQAGLTFEGGTVGGASGLQALVVNRSPPLVRILKWLNDYSNNVFHLLSDRIGGPTVVQETVRAHLILDARDEVVIDNAAGAGETNRMSPRVAVAVLQALERELARHRLSLTDALPVSGIDRGTLEARLLDHRAMVVGKTGTFGDVGASALVGVTHTRRWGTVTFAVLNSWVPVREARRRQDAFVRALLDAGSGLPWPYRRSLAPPFVDARLE